MYELYEHISYIIIDVYEYLCVYMVCMFIHIHALKIFYWTVYPIGDNTVTHGKGVKCTAKKFTNNAYK